MIRLLFLTVTVLQYAASEHEPIIVETNYGLVRGEGLTFKETSYIAFKGIPYAAPPLGALRFHAPQPPQKWTGVRDGTKYGNICIQPDKEESSEDCLTLNIYTPSLAPLKPVLFWIHGGGFVSGDSTDALYGPQYILQEDVVVVTINYRLGPFGFLAISGSRVTGNWALKDQVAALRWVQENISRFGGDPKQVTLYGESAGSIMAHLHMFSRLSRGLFQSAIASSGSSFGIVRSTYQSDKYSRTLAKRLGASDSEIEDPLERTKFLQAADANAIMKHAQQVWDDEDIADPLMDPLPFAITVEPFHFRDAFLTIHPEKLLADGKFAKKPLMMGVNDLEGGLAFTPSYGKNITPEALGELGKNVCLFLPSPLKEAILAKNECSIVSQKIRDVYFDGKSFDDSLRNFIYLWGDQFIVKDVHFAEKMHAQYATKDKPLYRYYFTFDGKWNFFKKMLSVKLPGALHGEDLFYVFRPSLYTPPELSDTSPEVITKNRMISFISNFVKYGNPTPTISADLVPIKWEPATKEIPYTMFIGNDLTLEREFLQTRMGMWEELYAIYNGSPGSLSTSRLRDYLKLLLLPVAVFLWVLGVFPFELILF